MSLIKGAPAPKFIVQKSGIADQTIVVAGHTDFDEEYDPVLIEHELQTGEIRNKLKWFRYHATIYFEEVEGENLVLLAKIFDINAYDTLLFYPNSVDKPYFFVDVRLDSETLKLGYLYLIAQKDFKCKVKGRIALDSVPLTLADFLMWGNISLTFADLTMLFSTLT
jgi:hypothetical protein